MPKRIATAAALLASGHGRPKTNACMHLSWCVQYIMHFHTDWLMVLHRYARKAVAVAMLGQVEEPKALYQACIKQFNNHAYFKTSLAKLEAAHA